MLEYIVDGAMRENPSRIVTQMNDIVTETKERAEVTEKYMQKWDELEHIKRDLRNAMADDVRREVTEAVKQEVTEEIRQKVTEEIRQKVTEEITQEVTDKVTQEVTDKITQEVTDKVTREIAAEADKKNAKELIDYGRLLGDSEENIRKRIVEKYDFDDETIEELLV